MLEFVEKSSSGLEGVVEVYILVPGSYQQAESSGGELDGRDGVCWGICQFELCYLNVSLRS